MNTLARMQRSADVSACKKEMCQSALQTLCQQGSMRCRGALQAGFLCYLLYLLTTQLDGYFDKQGIPSQFVARNISVTVQTIVRAVAYLFTFICGLNTVGLTGET